MSKKWKPSLPWLRRRAKQGFRGYSLPQWPSRAPLTDLATKIVVGIVRDERCEPDRLGVLVTSVPNSFSISLTQN